jgi:rhomboid protease GluP
MSLCALFHSASPVKCNEFNLVLQSVNFDSEVVNYDKRFYLLVEEERAAAAYQQLKLYVAENTEKKIQLTRPLQPLSKGFAAAYLYGLVLLIMAVIKNTQWLGLDWHSNGLAHSVKIMQGEWWRTITALSLHAESAHLLGNIGFGALFGILVAQYIGSGAAWFTILIAGAIGNALNAYLHQTLHFSIGASTMVFAALGILGIFALNDRHAYAQRGLRRWAPFLATLALLGFLGTGGERTDIMAHLSGYFCGCISGIVWLFVLRKNAAAIPAQKVFAYTSLGLVCLAWALALK